MKQNGIQVNNNNSSSSERLSAQQHSPSRAATQARGLFMWELPIMEKVSYLYMMLFCFLFVCFSYQEAMSFTSVRILLEFKGEPSS